MKLWQLVAILNKYADNASADYEVHIENKYLVIVKCVIVDEIKVDD